MSAEHIYYPEDRIPLPRLIPMGLQQVVAMFGATVLGMKGVTVSGLNIAGIAFGTVLALLLNLLLSSNTRYDRPQ